MLFTYSKQDLLCGFFFFTINWRPFGSSKSLILSDKFVWCQIWLLGGRLPQHFDLWDCSCPKYSRTFLWKNFGSASLILLPLVGYYVHAHVYSRNTKRCDTNHLRRQKIRSVNKLLVSTPIKFPIPITFEWLRLSTCYFILHHFSMVKYMLGSIATSYTHPGSNPP